MKFYSPRFSNLRILGTGIQFKDSYYETDAPAEIKQLHDAGFQPVDGSRVVPATITSVDESARAHSIPTRWTLQKIREYATEHSIIIPDNLTKRADITQFIENS